MSQITLTRLNRLVVAAIRAAERAPANTEAGRAAWVRVCDLEEQIADVLPAQSTEGGAARRGAVRAAVMAGDRPRARGLYDHYMHAGMPLELAEALERMCEAPRGAPLRGEGKSDANLRLSRRAMLDAVGAFRPGPPKDARYVGVRCPECGRSDGGHNSRCPKRLESVGPQKT